MPQTSKRAYSLASIDNAIKSTTCAYLLASDEDDEDEDNEVDEDYKDKEDEDHVDIGEEDIEDLLVMRETVAAHRYLAPMIPIATSSNK